MVGTSIQTPASPQTSWVTVDDVQGPAPSAAESQQEDRQWLKFSEVVSAGGSYRILGHVSQFFFFNRRHKGIISRCLFFIPSHEA